MREITDLNAFRKKKEEVKDAKDAKEKETAVDKNKDYEKLQGMSRINSDKLELMIKIGKSFRMNPATRATAEDYFKDSTEDDLVGFINNSNALELQAKPTYFIIAFGKLKRMLLNKFREE